MDEIIRLRDQAARARRLATATTDRQTIEALSHYAAECDREADDRARQVEPAPDESPR